MSVKFHEPICLDSAQDRFWWMDHFLGDQVQDEWRIAGTGSAVVVDQQTGGICRITTGALTNDWQLIDWNDIRSLLITKRVAMETRAKLTQTTNCIIYLSLRFDSDNRVFFAYDSNVGANWFINCEDGGVLTTLDSSIAADTSYHIFRIECHTHGGSHVHFYIDGTQTTNSPINTNVPDDAGDYLQPLMRVWTRADAIKSADIDYVAVRQDR